MAFRAAICDDSGEDAAFVQGLLEQWASARQLAVQALVFPSAESFLFHYAEDKNFDLLLLDIEMGAMDGVTVHGKQDFTVKRPLGEFERELDERFYRVGRALIKDAPVYEAIYISHRLSSCKFCDEIAVFHEGAVIQQGSHEALLADEGGKYHELWHAQAQYYTGEGA